MTWDSNTDPAYTRYENGENNHPDYGALYNWFVVDTMSNGEKNVCPSGWHVPSEAEGNALAFLTAALFGPVGVGGKGKVSGLGH